MNLIYNEIIKPNNYNKRNVLFLDDKLDNLKSTNDHLIPIHVKTKGIDEDLMTNIENL